MGREKGRRRRRKGVDRVVDCAAGLDVEKLW